MMLDKDILLDGHEFGGAGGSLFVGHVDSLQGWELLKPFWEAVHLQTPGAGVFQAYPYLRAWWDQIGSQGRPLIVVVIERGVPVAIAPLQITPVKQLRAPVRTVSFIGQPSESDRPTLLGAPEPRYATAVADHLLRLRREWDSVVLFEQPVNGELVRALGGRLRAEGYLTEEIPGNLCPYVDIQGTWAAYLAARTKAFRKSIKRRRAQLESMGRLECDILDETSTAAGLSRYRDVELRSWKPAQNLGIAASDKHWRFFQDLSRREGAAGWFRFAFLKLDGKDIAATFGLLWQRRYYSLHVAHDASHVDTSPGVVLTAMELESFFQQADCDHYDFLGGFLSNKRGWSSGMQATTALFGDRPRLRSRLFHLTYFRLKPWVRRMLVRLGADEYVTRKLHRYLKNRKPRADE